MATVHITLTDTPAGGVSTHTDFKPAIGKVATPAQSDALDFIAAERRKWGASPPLCQCFTELTESELNANVCNTCGNGLLV